MDALKASMFLLFYIFIILKSFQFLVNLILLLNLLAKSCMRFNCVGSVFLFYYCYCCYFAHFMLKDELCAVEHLEKVVLWSIEGGAFLQRT